jgi:hypothetical protein
MFTPAESGSGKTHFVKSMIRKMIPGNTLFFHFFTLVLMVLLFITGYFLLGIPTFVQTKEPADFHDLTHIQYLPPDFKVNEHQFATLPDHALVILDDFYFAQSNNKQEKLDFLGIVNYYLRHHNITLILIIHNIYSTNLSNDIFLAPHLFLAYSNLGFNLIR